MANYISLISSVATLILFVFYFSGRIITILTVNRIWKDKVIIGEHDYSQYEIVDNVYLGESLETTIYGILLSREGMRDITVYAVKTDKNGLLTQKGEQIYRKDFLNIDEAIAICTMTGDMFPSLIIEYTSFDYMKICLEWRDNNKNGVFSELVSPKHTVKSFLYYLLR